MSATKGRPQLGRLEAEVMEVLWTAGRPCSVREVLDALNGRLDRPLAYTTVMTVLARLTEKGVLDRTAQGRAFLYVPAVSDEADLAVLNVVRDHGEAALAHFVEHARSDPRLFRRLQRLIEEG